MLHHRRPTLLHAIAAAWVLGAACAPATAQPAQSPSELRRENDRLQEQVRTLEAQLEEARRRMGQLEELVTSLQAELEAMRRRQAESRADEATLGEEGEAGAEEGGGDAAPPEEPASSGDDAETADADSGGLPADDPFAGPGAMLRSLQREYRAAAAGLPHETEDQIERYQREVQQWIRRVQMRRRKAVEWRVELLDVDAVSAVEARCRFRVIGEGENGVRGRAFPLEVSGRHAARILDRRDAPEWVLEGIFAATPIYNDERTEPGVFNTPPLIGPYAEFDFEFRVRSLRPADDEAGQEPESAN